METTVITAENFDEIFKKYTSQDILNSNVIYYPMENGKFMCLKNRYGIDGIKTQSEMNEILCNAGIIQKDIDNSSTIY